MENFDTDNMNEYSESKPVSVIMTNANRAGPAENSADGTSSMNYEMHTLSKKVLQDDQTLGGASRNIMSCKNTPKPT
jgi:hypothetical protein